MHRFNDPSDILDQNLSLNLFIIDVVDCLISDSKRTFLGHIELIFLLNLVGVDQSIYEKFH